MELDRRDFLTALAAVPALSTLQQARPTPHYRVVTNHSPAARPGMPGLYPGRLSWRNLLYRVVPKPDRTLDLTVELGTPDFPEQTAANPSDFAGRVRAKLGDDKRLVRLYGTSTVMAHLTGDGKDARLYLLSYGGTRRQPAGTQQGIRVRVLGRYRPTTVAAYDAGPDAALKDVENPGEATEFSMPPFRTLAIVNLERLN
jgi:hypothetical protein